MDDHVGVALGEAPQGRGGVYAEHEPDGQAAPLLAGAARPVPGRVAGGEQPPRVMQELLARGSEGDLPAGTDEEVDAHVMF